MQLSQKIILAESILDSARSGVMPKMSRAIMLPSYYFILQSSLNIRCWQRCSRLILYNMCKP